MMYYDLAGELIFKIFEYLDIVFYSKEKPKTIKELLCGFIGGYNHIHGGKLYLKNGRIKNVEAAEYICEKCIARYFNLQNKYTGWLQVQYFELFPLSKWNDGKICPRDVFVAGSGIPNANDVFGTHCSKP